MKYLQVAPPNNSDLFWKEIYHITTRVYLGKWQNLVIAIVDRIGDDSFMSS